MSKGITMQDANDILWKAIRFQLLEYGIDLTNYYRVDFSVSSNYYNNFQTCVLDAKATYKEAIEIINIHLCNFIGATNIKERYEPVLHIEAYFEDAIDDKATVMINLRLKQTQTNNNN